MGSFISLLMAQPKAYPLVKTCTYDLAELAHWIQHNSGPMGWIGRIYVASTIWWDSDHNAFLQKGCGPNYMAGWWSMGCCNHKMLSGKFFGDLLKNQKDCPVFMFTLGSKYRLASQPLVSVAKITKDFQTPQDYANAVIKDPALCASRLTRLVQDNGLLGWRFGDCHADMTGVVGAPGKDHVHWVHNTWVKDNAPNVRKLLSNEFLVWDSPLIVAKRLLGPEGWGQA